MDLKNFLRIVFPNKDEEKFTKMIENLEREGFDSPTDLKYLDEEVTNKLESFNRIEIKKLKDYLEKNETLEEVLSEIFTGTPNDRITEIERLLKENDIYMRKDVLVIDIKILTSEKFFSKNEIAKIESFLQKNNKDHYNEIMNEKEIRKSDLTPTLRKIFKGEGVERIIKIEEILKRHSITAKKDLVFINLDKFKKEKILLHNEILKIEAFLEENHKDQFYEIKKKMELENSENLRHVLNELFVGTSSNRLEEIEQILNELEIYSGKDVCLIDLNTSFLKESLSNPEMSKFEEYFKKKYPVQYEKLMSAREFEKSKILKSVLKQIFMDAPDDRLAEIENILKEEHMYSGSDMTIVDTNTLRKKNSLTDIEILKIEEYIKKNNRERYDDLRAVKKAEDERKFANLQMEDEIKFYASKQNEELKFMQLKAHEERKMIEFTSAGKRSLREEETELMKAKAKVEIEQENLKVQIEKELMEARTMNDIKREDMKFQRDNLLMKEQFKEQMEREKINFQREKESREARLKEKMENVKFEQWKIELDVAKAKEKKGMQELNSKEEFKKKRYDSLMNEKKGLQDDIQCLENECIQLKREITQNSQKGIIGHFKNDSVKLKQAEDEYEFKQKSLKSKNDKIYAIDQELLDITVSLKRTKKYSKN